jgi:hypothetical protein
VLESFDADTRAAGKALINAIREDEPVDLRGGVVVIHDLAAEDPS